MQNEKLMSGSIFCLSISLVIGSLIIANGMKVNGSYIDNGLSNIDIDSHTGLITQDDVYTRNTFGFASAAGYLSITEDNLMKLIYSEESGIPYIKIGGSYIFSKSALDKWLENTSVEIK